VNFTDQAVNTVSPPQIVNVFNIVSSAATISSISILDDVDPTTQKPTSSSAPEDFKRIEPNVFSISLAAGNVLPVAVAFAPTDAKLRTALLTIAYNGAGTPSPQSPLQIKLSGTGTTAKK
jgi:hypothetical protein